MHHRTVSKNGSKGGTPATAMLQQAGVEFRVHEFDHEPSEKNYGIVAAEALGIDPEQVFKTLLAQVDGQAVVDDVAPSTVAVGIVPVSGQLSLKSLATAVHAKRADMCDPKVAERLTGYVVGGISPFGQKRLMPTAIDETCILFDTIFVSGGKRGLDIEIAPDDLITVLHAVLAPIGVPR